MKVSMQRLGLVSLMILIVVTGVHVGYAAEGNVPPHYLWIWEESIEPSQMDTYVKGRAEQAGLAAKHDFEFSYARFVQDFKVLTYGIFEEFAIMDSVLEKMAEHVRKTGGRDKELDDQCARCVRSNSSSIAVYRPDLSYHPEKPAFSPDFSKPFFTVTIDYNIKPDKYERAVEVGKRMKEFYEKKEALAGYLVYERICGDRLPTFFGIMYAKDKAQFLENEKKDVERFGAEAEQLFNKNLDILNGVEVFEREYSPLMSYMP